MRPTRAIRGGYVRFATRRTPTSDAETRALAERLLAVVADAPEHERAERLAGALRRA